MARRRSCASRDGMALRVRPDGWLLCEDAQRGPRHRCVKYKFAIESCEGLELHRFAVRFSDAQEQHRQLLSLGLLDSGVAFPAWVTDHARDMVNDEQNVQRRGRELHEYWTAVLMQQALLDNPRVMPVIGFDREMLRRLEGSLSEQKLRGKPRERPPKQVVAEAEQEEIQLLPVVWSPPGPEPEPEREPEPEPEPGPGPEPGWEPGLPRPRPGLARPPGQSACR